MLKRLLIASLLCLPLQAEEADHAVHEELRGLLNDIRASVNSADYDKMVPCLSEKLRLTTSLQEFVGSNKGVPEYLRGHFGPDKFVKEVKMEWEPEVLTELSPDKTWGLCYGKGSEDFHLKDGRSYHFLTRWTAVVAKEADGKWRIRSMHMGSNFLDNPLLTEVAGKAKKYSMYSGLGGALIGLFLGYTLGKRRK